MEIMEEREEGLQTSPNGSIWKVKKLGYVTGIIYNSEGTFIDWEFGKRNLLNYGERVYILKTISGAKRHLAKFERPEQTYIRPYYLETLIKKA